MNNIFCKMQLHSVYDAFSAPNLILSFGTTFTFNIFKMFYKSKNWINQRYLLTLGHWLNKSENSEVQAQTPPLKAASKLGLHYFLCRINATPAVKGLMMCLTSCCCGWCDNGLFMPWPGPSPATNVWCGYNRAKCYIIYWPFVTWKIETYHQGGTWRYVWTTNII